MKKMLFVFNPATGNGRIKNKLMEIICAFTYHGYEVTAYPTKAPGDAREYVLDKGCGVDLVVCCGGDGTLNEVVNGLLECKPMPLLGYIPGGTTNDYAASLHIPKANMAAATARILKSEKALELDIGRFNGKAFNYVAAFGAVAEASYSTPQVNKNLFGHFAYVAEALWRLKDATSYEMEVTADGETRSGCYALGMVTNTTSVGGYKLPGGSKIFMNDGLFEVFLVHMPRNIMEATELSTALIGKDLACPMIEFLRAKKITFVSGRDAPWTLDGEFGGNICKANINVDRKVLKICV